jgi:hypothetical protein
VHRSTCVVTSTAAPQALDAVHKVGWRAVKGNGEQRERALPHTCVIFSLLALGLSGASVSSTGCSSGATRSSL